MRTALATLTGSPEDPELVLRPGAQFAIEDYSRFKYGDGRAAERFGAQLAQTALAEGIVGREPVLITTSAFGRTPPAAHSLIAPFLAHPHRIAGPGMATVQRFRLIRSQISAGDYANMSLEERKAALSHEQVAVAPGVSLVGKPVIAIDDIRVTGVHEQAVDEALRRAGADAVHHLYIIDAGAYAGTPGIEGRLNAAAVDGVDALLEVSRSTRFIPNARFCKVVVALPAAKQARFVAEASPVLVDWVLKAADGEGLAEHAAYAEGLENLRLLALPAVG